jgi:hypothetical protein
MQRRHSWFVTLFPSESSSDAIEWALAIALLIVAAIAVIGAVNGAMVTH